MYKFWHMPIELFILFHYTMLLLCIPILLIKVEPLVFRLYDSCYNDKWRERENSQITYTAHSVYIIICVSNKISY